MSSDPIPPNTESVFFSQTHYMKLSVIHSRFPLRKTKSILVLFLLSAYFGIVSTAHAIDTTLLLSSEDYTETIPAEIVSSWLHFDTKLTLDPNHRSEAENIRFCPALGFFCDFSLSRFTRLHTKIQPQSSSVDGEIVKKFIDAFAEKVNQDPKNAVFAADEHDSVIVTEQEKVGRALKKDESVALIVRALESSEGGTIKINLPTEVAYPNIVANDRERLGLKELVGMGRTNFKGSTKNRIYNIRRGLEQFENALIAPGETFSFVTVLGDVDGEHGYLPELVIKDNKTLPEFGGGICQVSSTVFRAAINTGLKIVERRNHAYPVHYYYPYGMDATVYVPKPDLRFANNTPGYILMQSTIEGTELTFRFFGTKDGRTVKVDGPHVLESNPDGSMKTVFSQLVTDTTGETLINDSFWSNYKSPSLYPHPGQDTTLTEKPNDWSAKQWKAYKAIH